MVNAEEETRQASLSAEQAAAALMLGHADPSALGNAQSPEAMAMLRAVMQAASTVGLDPNMALAAMPLLPGIVPPPALDDAAAAAAAGIISVSNGDKEPVAPAPSESEAAHATPQASPTADDSPSADPEPSAPLPEAVPADPEDVPSSALPVATEAADQAAAPTPNASGGAEEQWRRLQQLQQLQQQAVQQQAAQQQAAQQQVAQQAAAQQQQQQAAAAVQQQQAAAAAQLQQQQLQQQQQLIQQHQLLRLQQQQLQHAQQHHHQHAQQQQQAQQLQHAQAAHQHQLHQLHQAAQQQAQQQAQQHQQAQSQAQQSQGAAQLPLDSADAAAQAGGGTLEHAPPPSSAYSQPLSSHAAGGHQLVMALNQAPLHLMPAAHGQQLHPGAPSQLAPGLGGNQLISLPQPSAPQGEEFTCTVCRKVFKRAANLIFHMTEHRPQPPQQQPEAEALTIGGGAGGSMGGASTGVGPVKCTDCDKEFATKYQAKKHYLRRHFNGDKPFACTKCGKKRFVVKEDLTMHMKACGNVFVCTCGIRLCSLGALKRHCKQFSHEPESLEPKPEHALGLPDPSAAAAWAVAADAMAPPAP